METRTPAIDQPLSTTGAVASARSTDNVERIAGSHPNG
jgi:hypothetical protein